MLVAKFSKRWSPDIQTSQGAVEGEALHVSAILFIACARDVMGGRFGFYIVLPSLVFVHSYGYSAVSFLNCLHPMISIQSYLMHDEQTFFLCAGAITMKPYNPEILPPVLLLRHPKRR